MVPPSGKLFRPTVFVMSRTVPYSVNIGGEYFFLEGLFTVDGFVSVGSFTVDGFISVGSGIAIESPRIKVDVILISLR